MQTIVDERFVFIIPGTALLVGREESCDVVVPPLRSWFFASYCIPPRTRSPVLVACTLAGDLLFTHEDKCVRLFIDGVLIKTSPKPRKLRERAVVSFDRCVREFSCIFVVRSPCTNDVQKGASPLAGASTSDSSLGEDCLLTVSSQPPMFHAQFGSESISLPLQRCVPMPDSEESVGEESAQPTQSSTPNEKAVPLKGEQLGPTVCTTTQTLTSWSLPRHDSGIRVSTAGETVSFSYNKGPEVSPPPLPSQSTLCYWEDALNDAVPPPYVFSPTVVERWGKRTVMHRIVGDAGSGGARERGLQHNRLSDEVECNDVDANPYATRRSVNEVKTLRQECGDQKVRTAAESVLECLNDVYECDDDAFMRFPEETKDTIFEQFLLMVNHAIKVTREFPLTLRLSSPIVCCGDIHGSFVDLRQIYDSVIPFGHWSLMVTPVLFLGDYVDRGPHDVEVMLFLLAWFVLCPENVFLLRGNHEDDNVNGDTKLYGQTSFLVKCLNFFGEKRGSVFWRRVNDFFAVLPVIAIVDRTIFMCHGGIPRLRRREFEGGNPATEEDIHMEAAQGGLRNMAVRRRTSVMSASVLALYSGYFVVEDVDALAESTIPTEDLMQELLESVPGDHADVRFYNVMADEGDDFVTSQRRRIVRELLWSDPVSCPSPHLDSSPRQGTSALIRPGMCSWGNDVKTGSLQSERGEFDSHGFRCNRARGCSFDTFREFNSVALENFLCRWGFSLVVRAHQQKDAGLELALAGRLLTLFSCSNYAGGENNGGACVITGGEVHPVSWRRAYTSQGGTTSAEDLDVWEMNQRKDASDCSGLYGSSLCSAAPPAYVNARTVVLG